MYTFADISESTKDLKFLPKTKIKEGIPRFIEWLKNTMNSYKVYLFVPYKNLNIFLFTFIV